MKRLILLSIPLALLGTAAHAQIPINQAGALAGGVVPGDAPGFPITISQPGSYKLTSNLTPPAGAGAIVVTAPNVSIDFNGFTIQGPATCTGTGVSLVCKGMTGADVGVSSSAGATSVRNGMVTGMAFAVNLLGTGGGASAEGMTLVGNAVGIQTSGNVRVRRNLLYRNQTALQLQAGNASLQTGLAEGNVVWDAGDGLSMTSSGLVLGNLISGAGFKGLNTGSQTAVGGNVMTGNANDSAPGPKVLGNACSGAPC